MFIDAYKLTARQAADEFARTAFGEPRKVKTFKPTGRNGVGLHGTFSLVNGYQFYEVWLTVDYRHFNIERVTGCQQ